MEKQENGPNYLHMLPKRKNKNKNQKQKRKKIIQQQQKKILYYIKISWDSVTCHQGMCTGISRPKHPKH